MRRLHRADNGRRINSCLTLAVMHEGEEITTIEGLAQGEQLHPMQEAFLEHDGFQCGYCTPGQICSAVACLQEGHAKDDAQIREWMSGNLCRCGAYPNIVDAIRQARDKMGGARVRPFDYSRAADWQGAINRVATDPQAKFLGGGTNLIDLMKMGVETPASLVDINRLPLAQVEELPGNGGIRIGALVRNSDLAEHPLITSRYPVLSEALLSGASPQLRNLATTGGNLLQRTRCYYFYDPAFPMCNKRNPGSGCGALEGYNRIHAILGQSDQCIATHPSDMCVALAALDAVVRVQGPGGERAIPMADFHRLPGTTPNIDTNLQPNELITSVDLPVIPFATRSHYLKVRDRATYAFALVSVAAVLELEDGMIKSARLALGGVAHKPWRATKAEQMLIGKKAEAPAFTAAAERRTRRREGLPIQHFQDRTGETRHRAGANNGRRDAMTKLNLASPRSDGAHSSSSHLVIHFVHSSFVLRHFD